MLPIKASSTESLSLSNIHSNETGSLNGRSVSRNWHLETKLKTAIKIVPFAIATFALSNIPIADAGAALYSLCLAACIPLAEAPPLLAICIAACTPLLPAPTP